MLEAGANPNIMNLNNTTVLIETVKNNCLVLVQYLLEMNSVPGNKKFFTLNIN